MTHNYTITGMTCAGCQTKVKKLLSQVDGVKNIEVDLGKGETTIEMDRHIPTVLFKTALKDYPKYQISEASHPTPAAPRHATPAAPYHASPAGTPAVLTDISDSLPTSWLATYKPILLIFGYITLIAVIAAQSANGFNGPLAMRVFMSGFFLTFSFFKILDLRGFADSYAMYDIVARRFRSWGYPYAFLELALGIAFAANYQPLLTNGITFGVMTISIIGVLQSVMNKRKIQCACLGAVFNLPMSTITIIEDALMIAMSGIVLLSSP
jgi:copper chaperone CopZ